MLTFFNKSGEGQLLNCCLLAQVGFDIKFQRYFIQDGNVETTIFYSLYIDKQGLLKSKSI